MLQNSQIRKDIAALYEIKRNFPRVRGKSRLTLHQARRQFLVGVSLMHLEINSGQPQASDSAIIRSVTIIFLLNSSFLREANQVELNNS